MNSKVIFYYILLYCCKYVASIALSEESARQTTYPPSNWQGNQNIPDHSRGQDTEISRTQNVNSMIHSAHRYDANKEYNARRDMQYENSALKKHELLPLHPLPIQEVSSESEIDSNLYPVKMLNQRYIKKKLPTRNNFYSASSARSNHNYRKPIPAKQEPEPHRQFIQPTGNHQFSKEEILPSIVSNSYSPSGVKYSNNIRFINPVERNLRTQNIADRYENYDVAHTAVHNTKKTLNERDRFLEKIPVYSGSSYMIPSTFRYHGPPVASENLNKEGFYNNNDQNRHLHNSQGNAQYNSPGRITLPVAPNLESDNSENIKYPEYPITRPTPRHAASHTHRYLPNPVLEPKPSYQDAAGNTYDKEYTYNNAPPDSTAENNESPSSGSIAYPKSEQEVFRKSSKASDLSKIKNILANLKIKPGHRFMIIHKNGTVEYLDKLEAIEDENPKYSILENGDISINDKNQYGPSQRPQAINNNDYRPSRTSHLSDDDSNSENETPKAFKAYQLNTPDTTTSNIWNPDDSGQIRENTDSSLKKPNDNDALISNIALTTSPQYIYTHEPRTQNPEDKKIQEYLDSLTQTDVIDSSPKPDIAPSSNDKKPLLEITSHDNNNDYYKNKPQWKKHTTAPSNLNTHKTSTKRPEDKKLQEYLDSIPQTDEIASSAKPYIATSGDNNKTLLEMISHVNNNDYYKNQPQWNKYITPPSNLYALKTSTQGLEDEKVQKYLDSLPPTDEIASSPKPTHNNHKSQKSNDDSDYPHHVTDTTRPSHSSTTENLEDALIQDFVDSLSKNQNSSYQTSTVSNDCTTEEATEPDSTNAPTTTTTTTTTTISPLATTVADEIITTSPMEMATDNVKDQDSDGVIIKSINNDTKTNSTSSTSTNSTSTYETNISDSINLKDVEKIYNNSAVNDYLANIDAPTDIDGHSTTETTSTQQSVINDSTTLSDLKLILDLPNDAEGTLKVMVNLPDNTVSKNKYEEEKIQIHVDTKDYKESDSTKKSTVSDDNNNEQGTNSKTDNDRNTLMDVLNSVVVWNKTSDKDFVNLSSSDNSTINLWYLIQMQPQCQPIVERSKVTTIYPNGTIVEEITETTRQNKDDSEPTVVKTTKISHKDHKNH